MQELLQNLSEIVKIQKDEIEQLQARVSELEDVNPIESRIRYVSMQVGVMGAIMPYLSNQQQAILVAEVVAELFNDDIVDKIKKFDFPDYIRNQPPMPTADGNTDDASVDNCGCGVDKCNCKPADFDDVNDAIVDAWRNPENHGREVYPVPEPEDADGPEATEADAAYAPEIYNLTNKDKDNY